MAPRRRDRTRPSASRKAKTGSAHAAERQWKPGTATTVSKASSGRRRSFVTATGKGRSMSAHRFYARGLRQCSPPAETGQLGRRALAVAARSAPLKGVAFTCSGTAEQRTTPCEPVGATEMLGEGAKVRYEAHALNRKTLSKPGPAQPAPDHWRTYKEGRKIHVGTSEPLPHRFIRGAATPLGGCRNSASGDAATSRVGPSSGPRIRGASGGRKGDGSFFLLCVCAG